MLRKLWMIMTVCCLMAGVKTLQAQETTSEIQGMVMDKTTPLAGAVVVAIHLPTATKYSTTTRNDGRYNLPNVKVGGPYEITVTYVGFKTDKQDGIFLSLGQEYKANFSLVAASSALSEVIVTGTRQDKVFNNNRTGSQEVVTRSQIERLPTVARSLQDFAKLEPTANNTSFGLSFGGRSSQYNNITVDGANFNNSFGLSGTLGGQTNSQPISLDAIEQIQVNVSPYDVTQGGFSGAGVNTVTRSGTNQFKGTVYTYLKGAGTQGYYVENASIVKTPITFNIKGASLGGPIIKNKLFFFVSGESVRQSLPATSIVASDASHSPGGNVAAANADTLNQLSAFLQSKFNYNPGAYQGYNFNTNSDKITLKFDWNINAKNTFTIKYNYLKSFADQFASTSRSGSASGANAIVTGGQPGSISLPFYGSGYVINNNFNILIAELNTRFSNKVSNKLQIGYTALRDFRSPHGDASFPLVDILNGAGTIYTTFGYEPFTYNNLLNTDVFQFSDVLKVYTGSHELTFGTQNYYRKYKNAFAPVYQGAYQFNSLTDFYSSVNSGAANARNYSLQYSALPDGSFPFAFAGSTELGFFVQDKWRATHNFTLTYGLRGDFTIYNQSFTDNPYFDALTFAGGKQYNIGKAPSTRPLVSPRVGFNWDITGDKSWQLRGGLGVFAGPPPFVWVSNQASNNGIQFGSFTNINTAFNANPNAYRPAAGAANASYSTALVSDNFKYPTVLKMGAALDKKFKNDWIATVEFNYSKDVNAVYYSNLNLNETNGFALGGADNRLRYLTAVANSNKYYSGTTLTNPNIGTAILMDNTNKGYAYTLTARVQKTFRNLFVSGAYTFADARNTAEGGSTASSLWSGRPVSADPNASNLAYASYYMPHRVIAYGSYRFEYAKHFATSIGLTFEAAPAGVTSYVYNGDLNGDGNAGNDLIYIPRNASEINLVKSGSGGLGTVASTDPRSGTLGTGAATVAANSQMWNQLNNFINQDHYLAYHRGEYAKANAVVFPFYKNVDLNITQDIYFVAKDKTKHTLRLTLDVQNLGNFLNRNWGIRKTSNLSNFLRYEGLGADGKTPSYSFTYLDANNQVPLANSYTNNTSIISRWQMQFGIRYLFN